MKHSIYKLVKSRQWDVGWLILGFALVIVSAVHDWPGQIQAVWATSLIGGFLGMTIVLLFANQKGKLGSGLGVVGAGFDTFNYYNYGALGNVFVGVYCGLLYLKGFFTLGKDIKVTKTTNLNLVIALGLAVVGGVVLYFFADTILPEGAPLWVLVLNVAIFLVQVISQYLMVEGKAISWIGWIIANFMNIALNGYFVSIGTSGALIYLAMTVMYQLNSFKAAFLWYGYGEEE
ncbi:MAG: nicotinamide mononucleotide transporter family protein [Propionibacteriaceae bacterium]|nr:nicotinamide mononucleotide transporter family protein [Propionibacteriaceae bacterium]